MLLQIIKKQGKSKCQKEIFVERAFNVIKEDIVKVPWVIKTEKYKGIVYIGNVSYYLGHYDELSVACFDILGNVFSFKLSEFDLGRLEYQPFEDEVAKKVYKGSIFN